MVVEGVLIALIVVAGIALVVSEIRKQLSEEAEDVSRLRSARWSAWTTSMQPRDQGRGTASSFSEHLPESREAGTISVTPAREIVRRDPQATTERKRPLLQTADASDAAVIPIEPASRGRPAIVRPSEGLPLDVSTLVPLLLEALVHTARRASTAELEADNLSTRVRELEAWLEEAARSNEVEHVQTGRLIAAAKARRIEHLTRPLVSTGTVLLVLYAAALAALGVLVALGYLV